METKINERGRRLTGAACVLIFSPHSTSSVKSRPSSASCSEGEWNQPPPFKVRIIKEELQAPQVTERTEV